MTKHRLLRTTLAVNALSSAVIGTGMALAAGPLSDLLGIPAWILVGLGIGLVPFAALVWAVRGRAPIRPAEVRWVIAADVAWVVGSALALGLAVGLTTAGRWAVGLVALAVADYAVLQAIGLRRPREGDGEGYPRRDQGGRRLAGRGA